MSSGEPMFDDDVGVTLQNCRFIPRHLGHNQVPFVYASPRVPALPPFLLLHLPPGPSVRRAPLRRPLSHCAVRESN